MIWNNRYLGIIGVLTLFSFVFAETEMKLYNEYGGPITQELINEVSSDPELEGFNIYEASFNENIDYSPLGNLPKLVSMIVLYSTDVDINMFKAAKNLKSLVVNDNTYVNGDIQDILDAIKIEEYSLNNIDDINNLKKYYYLKKLKITGITLTQESIDIITELENLETLTLSQYTLEKGINFESFKNFKKLTKLTLSDGNMPDVPDSTYPDNFFKYLENLEFLELDYTPLSQKNYEEIVGLKNLKELNLYHLEEKYVDLENITESSNITVLRIYVMRPYPFAPNFFEIFNKLEQLNIIGDTFTQKEVDGIKTLAPTLKELSLMYASCSNTPLDFGPITSIIKSAEERFYEECVLNYDSATTTTSKTTATSTTEKTTTKTKTTTTKTKKTKTKTTSTPLPTSKNGKCGKRHGKCPEGQCCSEDGKCGDTRNYCAISEGCRSKYGLCWTNKKCGKRYGKCPEGYCCNEDGECGKSSSYCSVSEGCRSKYGLCWPKNKCGKKHGRCPDGYCCNKNGKCGQTSTFCSVKKGCQSEYGLCY